jgi:hypothetical protein
MKTRLEERAQASREIDLYVWHNDAWKYYDARFATVQEALRVAQSQLAMGRAIKIDLNGQEA